MHSTTICLTWFCLLTFLAHAEPEQAKAGAPDFLTGAQVKTLLSERLTAGRTTVFRSRDGKFYGMDSDSVVSLEKDNSVVVGEYGYAYQGYRGTYAVAEDGVISVTLKGYRGDWPDMKIAREGDLIRLYSGDGNGNFVFGGRAGAVETEDMKPFWPFRLVETDSTPGVTPVYTGGELKTFVCPQIPDDLEWKGERIRFRLDVDISEAGVPKVQKYWTQDVTPSNQYSEGDWRLSVLAAATATVERWRFYPKKADGKPVPTNGYWHFDVFLVEGMVRWVIVDNAVTVFDSMPRRREE